MKARDLRISLQETLEVLGDQNLMAQLRQSIKEMEEGKAIPWEEAKRDIEKAVTSPSKA
ncbi:MAG: hypothetical protein ACOY8P_11855 [Thermodesulfobacteriota bacterium]